MRRSWVVMDLAAVLVFVGIGRSVHAHGLSFAGLFSTAWPFVSGLGTGWLVVAHLRRDAAGGPAGLVVLISTVAVGMVLRVVSGQGTAPAFVGVALGFLGATMLGWRLGLAVLVRRQAPGRTSG
jgi:hypothetical protein